MMNEHRFRLTKQWLRRRGHMSERQRPARRIGIYAGSFDPVHAGHIGFALQAIQAAKLDEVVFMPERMPRHSPGVEHYAHRIAMLRSAIRPHPRLAVMEMVDRRHSVARTLPQLTALYPGDRLVFLLGSDAAAALPQWPYANQLLRQSELVVGVHGEKARTAIEREIADWETQPQKLTVIESFAPDVSSADIRKALRANRSAKGLLASVKRYAKRQWLYVSVRSK